MDPRDAVGKLMRHKMDGRQLRKMLKDRILKTETAPVQSGAKRGSYVPKKEPHYDEFGTMKYKCPDCDRIYESRNDIDPSTMKCQYHDVTLKPVKDDPKSDGDDREKRRHAQPEKNVNKSEIKDKHPEAFAQGYQYAELDTQGALDVVQKLYGSGTKQARMYVGNDTSGLDTGGRGASFMRGWQYARMQKAQSQRG